MFQLQKYSAGAASMLGAIHVHQLFSDWPTKDSELTLHILKQMCHQVTLTMTIQSRWETGKYVFQIHL